MFKDLLFPFCFPYSSPFLFLCLFSLLIFILKSTETSGYKFILFRSPAKKKEGKMQIIYVPLSYLFDLRCCTPTLYNNEIHLWREKKKGISKSFSFFFMALHFIAFVLSICSLVLLLLANIGTTFSSSVLNKLYLVEISESVTGRSIRYGVYNSCLYYKNATDAAQSCTSKAPAYSFSKAII